ncbi:MAG: hypothetical protein EON58_15550 [Alphaproteobacteria bacterium]|nr:MAG: hypothetical protein EON58_15550 [Alphaproteobacteria bacterium]
MDARRCAEIRSLQNPAALRSDENFPDGELNTVHAHEKKTRASSAVHAHETNNKRRFIKVTKRTRSPLLNFLTNKIRPFGSRTVGHDGRT